MLTVTEFNAQAAGLIRGYQNHQVPLESAATDLSLATDELLQPYVVGTPPDSIMEAAVRRHAELVIAGYIEGDITEGGAYLSIKECIEDMIPDPDLQASLLQELCGDLKPPSQPDSPEP